MSAHVVFDNSGLSTTERIKVFSATSGIDVECHPMLLQDCETDRCYTPADEVSRVECRCRRPLGRSRDMHLERIGRYLLCSSVVEIEHDRSVPVHLVDFRM
jgi:hypothetical protein